MINLDKFPEINLSKDILEESLKLLIYEAFKNYDPSLVPINDFDFTIYEGIGSFMSGPFDYDSEGKKRLDNSPQHIKHYIFDSIPALILANTFDKLHPSSFITRPHPTQDYRVKVQYSEKNHLKFIIFNEFAFILSVNQVPVVDENSLSTPDKEVKQRIDFIENFITQQKKGVIPHRLASEFYESTKLYKREEIENAPNWNILQYRDITKEELKQLNRPYHKVNWIIWGFIYAVSLLSLLFESYYAVLFSVFFFVILILKLNLIPLKKFLNEQVITIRGVLKAHPKVVFSGPLEVSLLDEEQGASSKQKTIYTFDVLKNSRKIIYINELSSVFKLDCNVIKSIKLQIYLALILMISVLAAWKIVPSAFTTEESLLTKNQNYFNILKWYFDPTPMKLDHEKNPDIIPKKGTAVDINGLIQCNITDISYFCNLLQLAPNNSNFTTVKADISKVPFSDYPYFTLLHKHYQSLEPQNAYRLSSDVMALHTLKSISKLKNHFETSEDLIDSTNILGLTEQGFEFFSTPFYINLNGFITDVTYYDTPKKYWIADIKFKIDEHVPLALYNTSLVIYMLFLVGFIVWKVRSLLLVKKKQS